PRASRAWSRRPRNEASANRATSLPPPPSSKATPTTWPHRFRAASSRSPAVVLWIPDHETATDHARRALPETVSLADASFNIGRTALLVAALAAGDVDALCSATE